MPAARRGSPERLIADGFMRADPIVYEDFLPVSAAGIFQSNLGDTAAGDARPAGAREAFEAALGRAVRDEIELYAAAQADSLRSARAMLSPTGGARSVTSDPGTLTAHADRAPYERGARGETGRAAFVLRPRDTAEALCRHRALCPRPGAPGAAGREHGAGGGFRTRRLRPAGDRLDGPPPGRDRRRRRPSAPRPCPPACASPR